MTLYSEKMLGSIKSTVNIEQVYPVGSIYLSVTDTCPIQDLIEGSVWEKIASNISIGQTAPVIGNGMAVGFTNGSSNRGLAMNNGALGQSSFFTSLYGADVGTKASSTDNPNGAVGVVTDASKSGLVAKLSYITINIFKRTK